MAQRIPLPLTVSCSSKIQIGFTFLVAAHPSSPNTNAMSSIPSLSLSSLLGNLSFSLMPHIHLTILISARWSATTFSFLPVCVCLLRCNYISTNRYLSWYAMLVCHVRIINLIKIYYCRLQFQILKHQLTTQVYSEMQIYWFEWLRQSSFSSCEDAEA